MKKRIITMLVAVMLMAALAGCGSSAGEAKQACEGFFAAYSSNDPQGIAQYLEDADPEEELSQMQSAVARKITAEVGKAKVNKDSAEIQVKVTSVDIENVFNSLPENLDSVDSAKTALMDALEADDVSLKDFDITVNMSKVEDQWMIVMNAELSDALLGGINSMLNGYGQEVAE